MIFGLMIFLLTLFKVFEYNNTVNPPRPSKFVNYNGMKVQREWLHIINRNGRKTIQPRGNGKPMTLRPSLKSKLIRQAKTNLPVIVISIVLGIVIGHIWSTAIIPFIGIGSTAYTWDNGGGTGVASLNTNWSPDGVPGAATGDTITFDGTSVANCSFDLVLANALTSMTITGSYTGTVTLAVSQTASVGTLTVTGTHTNYALTNGNYNLVVTVMSINGHKCCTSGTGNYQCYGNVTTTSGFPYDGFVGNLRFMANSTYTPNANCPYNVTVDVGVTLITSGNHWYNGVFTLNGTANIGTYIALQLGSNPDVFVYGASGNITGGQLWFYPTGTGTINIPAGAYQSILCQVGGSSWARTWTFTGNITCTNLTIFTGTGTDYAIVNTGNYSINASAYINVCGGATGAQIRFNGGSSTITTGTYFYISCTGSYLNLTSATFNIGGDFYVDSTSASWAYGTSTFNFNGTDAQWLRMNTNNSANVKYFNITISNSGTGNITIENTIVVLGALNCSTATAKLYWDSRPTGIVTVYGGITIGNGCTWADGASLVLHGNQTITDNNAIAKSLGNVTIDAGYTITYAKKLLVGVLVNNGTWANAPSYPIYEAPTAVWDSLTIGAGSVLNTTAFGGSIKPTISSPSISSATMTENGNVKISCTVSGSPTRGWVVFTDGSDNVVATKELTFTGTTAYATTDTMRIPSGTYSAGRIEIRIENDIGDSAKDETLELTVTAATLFKTWQKNWIKYVRDQLRANSTLTGTSGLIRIEIGSENVTEFMSDVDKRPIAYILWPEDTINGMGHRALNHEMETEIRLFESHDAAGYTDFNVVDAEEKFNDILGDLYDALLALRKPGRQAGYWHEFEPTKVTPAGWAKLKSGHVLFSGIIKIKVTNKRTEDGL